MAQSILSWGWLRQLPGHDAPWARALSPTGGGSSDGPARGGGRALCSRWFSFPCTGGGGEDLLQGGGSMKRRCERSPHSKGCPCWWAHSVRRSQRGHVALCGALSSAVQVITAPLKAHHQETIKCKYLPDLLPSPITSLTFRDLGSRGSRDWELPLSPRPLRAHPSPLGQRQPFIYPTSFL